MILAPGNLLSNARRVEAGDITKTQAYRSGQIVIQDEASQLVAALVGTTAALCLASTLLVAACAVRMEPYDFPVMRLTNPPAADAQPPQ